MENRVKGSKSFYGAAIVHLLVNNFLLGSQAHGNLIQALPPVFTLQCLTGKQIKTTHLLSPTGISTFDTYVSSVFIPYNQEAQ